MTNDTAITEQARAVFLAALMVLSVMVGTVALSGGAAAAVSSSTLETTVIQPGEDVRVTGSVDSNYDGETLYVVTSDDGTYQEGSDSIQTTTQTAAEDDTFDVTAATDVNLGLSAGDETTIYVNQGAPTDGDSLDNEAGTVLVDGTAPVVDSTSPANTDTVSTDTPVITVSMTEGESSINASTIEVSASNGGNQLFELNEPEAQGISYDSSTQNLTIDIAQTKLDELPDGQINVDVTAQDEAGNALTDGKALTSFTFTVDTNPVSASVVTAPTEDTTVTDASQTIEAHVDSTAADLQSAEVTVYADGYEESVTMSDNAYTEVDSTEGDFSFSTGDTESDALPPLPEGVVAVVVTTTDANGDMAWDVRNFSVDTNAPVVTDVTVNDGELVNKDNAGEVPVTVTFNETVQADSVSGGIHLDDDGIAEVDLGAASPVETGENVQTVTYLVDLSSSTLGNSYENSSAEVQFSSADDEHTNTNGSLDATETFEIDTVSPTATIDTNELPAGITFENVVDLSEAFSASDADGNEYEVYIDLGQSGEYVLLSDVSSEPLADFDTTTLPEGTHDLKVSVSDDAGNTGSDSVVVTVDNYEPSLDYEGDDPLTGMESGTEYEIADLVSASNNGTVTVNNYGYAPSSTTVETWDDVTSASSVTVDSNTEYVFAAELEDGTVVTTDAVETSVLEAGTFTITAETNESDEGTIDVEVTSDTELGSLSVTAETDDNYYSQYDETLDNHDFEQVNNGDGTYTYTLTYDAERDGEYTFSIDNATEEGTGLSIEELAKSDSAAADGSAPSVVDADVVSGDKDELTVRVRFSEPVSTIGSVEQFDGHDVVLADGSIDQDGVTNYTVQGMAQTGGDAELTFTDVTEANDEDSDATTDSTGADVTFSLELSEGVNVVSVPAETGSVHEIEFDGVNSIWTYDQEFDGDNWQKYIVDSDEGNLNALEGGQGYIIRANEDTEIDYEVENKPAALDNDGGLQERNEQKLEAGWNLVGHYQEGSQDVDQAFVDLTDHVWSVEDGYTGDQPQELSLEQGYWMHVNTDALYRPVSYDGPQSEQPDVFNAQIGDESDYSVDDSLSLAFEVTHDQPLDSVRVMSSDLNIDEELSIASDQTSYDSSNGDAAATVGQPSDAALDAGEADVTVAVVDIYGNTQYVTGTVSVDNTAPQNPSSVTVTSTTPINADTEGSVVADVGFSSAPEDGTVTLQFSDGTNTVTETAVAANPTSFSGVDISSLNDGQISATAKITDANGNVNSDGFTAETTFQKDTDGAGASNIQTSASSGELTFTFDSDEQLGSGTSDVAASVSSDGTFTTVNFDRDDFTESSSGGTYTYSLKDTSSVTLGDAGDHTVSVTTAKDVAGNDAETLPSDATYTADAPSLTSSSPSDGATGVDYTTVDSIELTFSEAISVTDSTQITLTDGSGTTVTTTVTDASADSTITVTADNGLSAGTDYTLTVSSGAVTDTDGDSKSNGEETVSFTTAA